MILLLIWFKFQFLCLLLFILLFNVLFWDLVEN